MTFEYRDGYWKAILDLYNFTQAEENRIINSKKKYENFIHTLLDTLLKNPDFLDKYIEVGGDVSHIDTHDCLVKKDGTFFIKEKGREE